MEDTVKSDMSQSARDKGLSSKVDQNVVQNKKMLNISHQSSSLAVKNYMEEMELKIRYIKNDIEFKREQMKQNKRKDITLNSDGGRQCSPYHQKAATITDVNRNLFPRGRTIVAKGHNLYPNRKSLGNVLHTSLQRQDGANDRLSSETLTSEKLGVKKASETNAVPFTSQLKNTTFVSSHSVRSTENQNHSCIVVAPKSQQQKTLNVSSTLTLPMHDKSKNSRIVIQSSSAGSQMQMPTVFNKQLSDSTQTVPVVRSKLIHAPRFSSPVKAQSLPACTTLLKKFPSKYKYSARKSFDRRTDSGFSSCSISSSNSSLSNNSITGNRCNHDTSGANTNESRDKFFKSLVSTSRSSATSGNSLSKYKYVSPKLIDKGSKSPHSPDLQVMQHPAQMSSNALEFVTNTDRTPLPNSSSLQESKDLKNLSPLKIKPIVKLTSENKLKQLSSPTSSSKSKALPSFHPSHTSLIRSLKKEQISSLSLKARSAAKLVSRYSLKRLSPSSKSHFYHSKLTKNFPKKDQESLQGSGVRASARVISKYKLRHLSSPSAAKMMPHSHFTGSTMTGMGKNFKRSNGSTFAFHGFTRKNVFKLDKRENSSALESVCKSSQRSQESNNFSTKFSLRRRSFNQNLSKRRLSLRHSGSSSASSNLYKEKIFFKGQNKKLGLKWMSAEAQAKDLKRRLASKRNVALTRFRWKSSAKFSSAPSRASSFHWSSCQEVGSRRHGFHLRQHRKSYHTSRSSRLVMIGGTVYKSSPRSLQRAVQGKERVAASSLIVVRDKMKIIRYGAVAENPKLTAASRAVQRSLAFVVAKHKKDYQVGKQKQKYCMFFCRFGKCHRGDACPYVHDKNKVVVCTRFLRGKCDMANCTFSHDASPHKMPVCLHYLQGQCSRRDCLYLHVNVSPTAPPCKDFFEGYCPLGTKCKKLHSFVCPSFSAFGKCLKGDKCSLLHRRFKKSTVVSSQSSSSSSAPAAVVLPSKSSPEQSISDSTLENNPGCQIASTSTDNVRQLETESGGGKSVDLRSQPAFISLPSLPLPVAHVERKGRDLEIRAAKVVKTKIKPEFLNPKVKSAMNFKEKSTASVGHPVAMTNRVVNDSSKCLSPEMGNADFTETVSKVVDSNFINLSPSTSSDFIKMGSSPEDSQETEMREDVHRNPNCDKGKNLLSKTLSSTNVLFKGIIPNFLPRASPKRNSPTSN